MITLGKVIKKLAGTTPYWVVVYVGPTVFVIKKVVENQNATDEFTIDNSMDEAHNVSSYATQFEEVQALDLTSQL